MVAADFASLFDIENYYFNYVYKSNKFSDF